MNAKTRRQFEQILMFAIRIQNKMKDETLETFLTDEDKQDAILYRLGQIGEVASKISDEEQEKYPSLFWRQMIGLRHRLFHEYQEIDLTQIYAITQQPISSLISELKVILSNH